MKVWRDVGNGRVRCDSSGETAVINRGLSVLDADVTARTVVFSREEWAKLQALAEHRTQTPRICLADFIAAAYVGDSS